MAAVSAGETAAPPAYPTIIAPLTSLRFFAAIWVVTLHYSTWPADWGEMPIISQGTLAVDFFFVLSGFILAHAHIRQILADTLDFGTFVVKRLARIYPLHLATLLFYIALVGGLLLAGVDLPNAARYDPRQIVPNLLLIQAWQAVDRGAWNYPSWSVSAEWFAYLLFPWLAGEIFHRLAAISSRWLLAGALAWLFVVWSASPFLFGHGYFELHSNFGYVRIMPEFLLGMALYRFGREHDVGWLAARGAFATIAVAALVFAWLAQQLAMVVALALLILSAAERARRGRAGLLDARWLVYLGEVSYALYMVHLPVATVLLGGARLARGSTPLWLMPIAMIVAVLVAMAVHHMVELPGQRLVLRFAARDRRRKATTGSAPPTVRTT